MFTYAFRLRKLQSTIQTREQKQAEERAKRLEKRAATEATALPALSAHKTPVKEPDFVDPKQLSGDLRNIQSTSKYSFGTSSLLCVYFIEVGIL